MRRIWDAIFFARVSTTASYFRLKGVKEGKEILYKIKYKREKTHFEEKTKFYSVLARNNNLLLFCVASRTADIGHPCLNNWIFKWRYDYLGSSYS